MNRRIIRCQCIHEDGCPEFGGKNAYRFVALSMSTSGYSAVLVDRHVIMLYGEALSGLMVMEELSRKTIVLETSSNLEVAKFGDISSQLGAMMRRRITEVHIVVGVTTGCIVRLLLRSCKRADSPQYLR